MRGYVCLINPMELGMEVMFVDKQSFFHFIMFKTIQLISYIIKLRLIKSLLVYSKGKKFPSSGIFLSVPLDCPFVTSVPP